MSDSVTPLSHGGNTARDSWAGTVFLVVLSATVTYTVLLMAGSFGAPGEEPLLPVQINPRFAVAGFAVGAAVIYSVNSAVMWCAKKAPGTTYILALVFCMLLCFVDIIGIAVDKVMLPDVKPSVMIIPIEIIVICVLFLVRAKKQLPLIQELLRASFSATAGLRWLPLDVLSFAVSAASLWATCAVIASILHHGAAAAIVISLVLLWSLFTWVFCLSSASTRCICTWYTGCGAPLPANAPIASLHRAVTVQLGTHALRAGILLLHIASCWTLALVSFLLYQLRRCSVFENGIIVRFARQMLSPLVAHSQLSVAMDASASEAAERALLNFKRDVALMKRLPIDAVMVGIAPIYGLFMLVSMLSRMFPSVDVAVFAIGALFALTCNTSSGVAVTTTMQTLRLLYSNSVSTFAVVLPEANRLINEISGPLPAEFAAEVEMAAPAPEGVVEGVVVEVAAAAEEKPEKEAA